MDKLIKTILGLTENIALLIKLFIDKNADSNIERILVSFLNIL